MVIVEIGGSLVTFASLLDQIYSLEDVQGWHHHYNVTAGLRLAESRGGLTFFSPSEHSITVETIRAAYVDLDVRHALTTDLSRPLLFVTLRGKSQLADGWHRLYKAVVTGQRLLPAYALTERESESILALRLPPGKGIDWGQNEPGEQKEQRPSTANAETTDETQSEKRRSS